MQSKNQPHNSICEWPLADRPREKLLKHGAEQLSNSELLAILLSTGSRGESALDLARKIIEKFKTFRSMSHAQSRSWNDIRGLGPAKIAQIRAAIEIGRRFREDEVRQEQRQIKSSRDVVDILMPQMRDLKIEVFKTVLLNSQNRIIKIVDVTQGTVNRASPFIREILHKALELYAVAMVCVHNHPSGDITPSSEDRQFTNDLSQASKVLGIRLLDHLIIGDDQYYSFTNARQIALKQ